LGRVLLEVVLYPESADVLDSVRSSLQSKLAEVAEIVDVSERPIAFGLSAIAVRLIVDESLGTEPVERVLGEISGLSSFNIERVTRVL